jgi:hypothetical protein
MFLIYFILFTIISATDLCAWNYRFDSVDNHFNIVYPDKNAVYFGTILPSQTSNLIISNPRNHPIATYFSIQIYHEDAALYHFNDVELLDGNMDIMTVYSLNLTLDSELRYFALFRIYESQVHLNSEALNYWSASLPVTFINNIRYSLCDIDYSQQGNIYSYSNETACSYLDEFMFMDAPAHSLMNSDANYMIACIRPGVNYTMSIVLPEIMKYPDFDSFYDLRYASLSIVSTSRPRPTVSTVSLGTYNSVYKEAIFIDDSVPNPALLYRQLLPNPKFDHSIEKAREKCGSDIKCIKVVMGKYYPRIEY